MIKSNKLPHELQTLLQSPIEKWDSYDWATLEPNQADNCALFLKITNAFDKLKHLINILLNLDQEYTVYHIIKEYPELINQLQLTHVKTLLRVVRDHPRNCKYLSDMQWKIISDYSQEYSHLYPQFDKPMMYHNNHSYQHKTQINHINHTFQDILLNPQYHEYITKFIQFNIQVYQLDALFNNVEQTIIKPQYKQSKESISKIINYIKTTKWYKDNLVGDKVGYNVEKCPIEDITAQDLRDLFE